MCSGRGIVATAFIPKGARFFDPAVRYHENQSPLGLESRRLYLDVAHTHTHTHTHRYHANKSPHGLHPNYYIEVPDGGYFEIARDSNGPFKSDTYYLNEARPDNQLVGSQQPNVRYDSFPFLLSALPPPPPSSSPVVCVCVCVCVCVLMYICTYISCGGDAFCAALQSH